MNNVLKIKGLDCANCARELEEEILKISGVQSASVDFIGQKVRVDCDSLTLEKVVDVCNNFEDVKVVQDTAENSVSCGISGEKIKITGLCCANCARELEEDLNKIEGVKAAVDFINLQINLSSETTESRERAIYAITHFEDVKIVKEKSEKSLFKTHLKDIICLICATVLFIPAIVLDLTKTVELSLAVKIVTYVLYGLSYLTVGHKVLINTAKNIVKGKIFDENFLMTVASIGAVLLGIFSGDGFFEGVAVMLLYELGELLQSIAVGSSRGAITKLMSLKSDTATLLKDGKQAVISPDELKIGDIILIKAGEKVPVDCKITKGETSLDTKSLTGEALPCDVSVGKEILSGCINLSGVIEAEVIREYKNSAVAKILELVENSTAAKAKPEKFISKFAKYYTPLVCGAAVIVGVLVPTIICAVNSLFNWDGYSEWVYRALNFLVISCPCALVISVPLSYFSGIGRCAKSGILVKGSTSLDALALATVAAFDKTGTITEGAFSVLSYSSKQALSLAASAEKYSSHPIAAAFSGIEGENVENVEEIAGRGIKCLCGGKVLLCGNAKLMAENGVVFQAKESVSTLVYVALNGEYIGVIEVGDKIKEGAAEAIKALKDLGVERTMMLTGDSEERAKIIAQSAGLDGYAANLLPDEKPVEAEKLKKQGKLLYAGDGINDAPVMTISDCAVSMGQVGSDAAIEASDIVLVSDNLKLLPEAKRVAKRTRTIVFENIAGSLVIKLAIMVLGVTLPAFPLIAAVIADVGVMLIAVLNAMRTAFIK